jgi:hypothetical protein
MPNTAGTGRQKTLPADQLVPEHALLADQGRQAEQAARNGPVALVAAEPVEEVARHAADTGYAVAVHAAGETEGNARRAGLAVYQARTGVHLALSAVSGAEAEDGVERVALLAGEASICGRGETGLTARDSADRSAAAAVAGQHITLATECAERRAEAGHAVSNARTDQLALPAHQLIVIHTHSAGRSIAEETVEEPTTGTVRDAADGVGAEGEAEDAVSAGGKRAAGLAVGDETETSSAAAPTDAQLIAHLALHTHAHIVGTVLAVPHPASQLAPPPQRSQTIASTALKTDIVAETTAAVCHCYLRTIQCTTAIDPIVGHHTPSTDLGRQTVATVKMTTHRLTTSSIRRQNITRKTVITFCTTASNTVTD